MSNIRIVDFEPQHSQVFSDLNIEWMSEHWVKDDTFDSVLDKPQEEIIDTGDAIKIALLDGLPVGTCALIKKLDSRYELAKTCVTVAAQGQGLGKLLVQLTLERAEQLGAETVFLKTSPALGAAIALYKKLGFETIESCGTEDSRCDIQMELSFN